MCVCVYVRMLNWMQIVADDARDLSRVKAQV